MAPKAKGKAKAAAAAEAAEGAAAGVAAEGAAAAYAAVAAPSKRKSSDWGWCYPPGYSYAKKNKKKEKMATNGGAVAKSRVRVLCG
jgi:hypothetical protein